MGLLDYMMSCMDTLLKIKMALTHFGLLHFGSKISQCYSSSKEGCLALDLILFTLRLSKIRAFNSDGALSVQGHRVSWQP